MQSKTWVPVTVHSGAFKDAVDALNKITHTQMDLKMMQRQNLTAAYCVDLNFRSSKKKKRGKVVVLTHTRQELNYWTDPNSRAWGSLEVQFIHEKSRAGDLVQLSPPPVAAFSPLSCLPVLPGSASLPSLPSEVYELCRYDVWRSSALKLAADLCCSEQQQQPPQHPPSFTPSPRLKFVLPHMQGSLDPPLLWALIQCKTKGRLCCSSKAW